MNADLLESRFLQQKLKRGSTSSDIATTVLAIQPETIKNKG